MSTCPTSTASRPPSSSGSTARPSTRRSSSSPRTPTRCRRRAAERTAAQEATQRSEFLAFASRELGASLNLDEGMERLLQMLVPGLAGYGVLWVPLEDDQLVMHCSGGAARPQLVSGLGLFPERLEQAPRDRR